MMNEEKTTCVVCKNPNASSILRTKEGVVKYDCPTCSQFNISPTMETKLSHDTNYPNDRYLISGFTRNLHDNNNVIFNIYSDTLEKLLNDGDPRIIAPKNMDDKLNMILFYIKRKTSYPSENVKINHLHDYSICFAKNFEEFTFYLQHLTKLELIQMSSSSSNNSNYYLTVKGFEYISKLQDFNIHSNRCFVAMSFKPEYEAIYAKAIKPAIEKANYMPIRIDEVNSANPDIEANIDDRLITEIRMSRFIIADFTEKSLNVYYEAGFACGFGIKVIRCCEKQAIDNGALPFDTRNRDHLAWEYGKEEEFLDALYHRIVALLGKGTFKPD